MKKREKDADDEGDASGEDQKDTEAKKRQKKKGKRREKRADEGGDAKNGTDEDRNSTGEEQAAPRTPERRIYRGNKTRKLRKLNDGGKLEIVQVKTHNSSDYNSMVLRPKGRKRSKNERGRRARIEDILECEGGGLDP